MFGEFSPSLRKISFLRLTETMVSLDSLFNSLLYCYRNRKFRKAVLELVIPGKYRRVQPESNQVGALENVEQRQFRWTRSQSYDTLRCSDQVEQRSHETMVRAAPAPSCLARTPTLYPECERFSVSGLSPCRHWKTRRNCVTATTDQSYCESSY